LFNCDRFPLTNPKAAIAITALGFKRYLR
jgi:hypothetical protein